MLMLTEKEAEVIPFPAERHGISNRFRSRTSSAVSCRTSAKPTTSHASKSLAGGLDR